MTRIRKTYMKKYRRASNGRPMREIIPGWENGWRSHLRKRKAAIEPVTIEDLELDDKAILDKLERKVMEK